jgi:bifunctional DNase/RNase
MAAVDTIFVAVEIKALLVEPNTQAPVVILQVADGTDILPIWIGGYEAQAIAMAVEGITPPRPMTHDLLKSIIDRTGFEGARIRIHALDDGVFKAVARLEGSGDPRQVLDIDARPSDAIALALRAHASIEVSQEVLDQARIQDETIDDAFRTLLEQLDPDAFGQYEM